MSRPRVVLTQSRGRLDGLSELLEGAGFEAVHRPLIETNVRTDSHTRSAAFKLGAMPWLLLTSRSTVEALVALGALPNGDERSSSAEAGARSPAGRKVAAGSGEQTEPLIGVVGPATAAAVETAGGSVELVGVPSDARGLAQTFLAHPAARGPVGLPRGNRALDTLERELGEAGFATRPLVVYDTVTNEDAVRDWPSEPVAAVVLASPSAVEALPAQAGESGRLVTLGSTTARAVRARGWQCVEAREPSPGAVLAALEGVVK